MTPAPATKFRLRFAKRGDLRLLSHHDLLRSLERTLRRAEVPVAKSQGFNPRPKAVFTLALGLGIEGRREVLELELTEPMEASDLLERLGRESPPGFDFLEAEPIGPGRSAQAAAVAYALDLPAERRDDVRGRLDAFLASPRWPYLRVRPDRTSEFDLRPFVLSADLGAEGVLRFRLKVDPSGSARPEELAEALGLRDVLSGGGYLVRTDIELIAPPADPPKSPSLTPDRASERSIA